MRSVLPLNTRIALTCAPALMSSPYDVPVSQLAGVPIEAWAVARDGRREYD